MDTLLVLHQIKHLNVFLNNILPADVNECEEARPCASHQTCQNSYGSYRCLDSVDCPAGYKANTNEDCVGKFICVALDL